MSSLSSILSLMLMPDKVVELYFGGEVAGMYHLLWLVAIVKLFVAHCFSGNFRAGGDLRDCSCPVP